MARPKKEKGEKKGANLKLANDNDEAPKGTGHNSGKVIPEVQSKFDEILKLREQKRALGKQETEIKNFLKDKFGLSKRAITIELAMQSLDKTVRIQLEAELNDVKVMTGYQMALDLKENTVARTEEEFVDPSDPEAEANKLAGVAR